MGRSKADIKFQHPYELVGSENEMPAFETRSGRKRLLKFQLKF